MQLNVSQLHFCVIKEKFGFIFSKAFAGAAPALCVAF